MAAFLMLSGLAPALLAGFLLWGAGHDFLVIAVAYVLSGSLGLLGGAGLAQAWHGGLAKGGPGLGPDLHPDLRPNPCPDPREE